MDPKEGPLQKAYDLVYKYEAERGSCPQCVYSAIMKTLEVGDPATSPSCRCFSWRWCILN